MAKYDRGTARKIGQLMRKCQDGDRGKGKARQHLARNRRQVIAMALAEVREERSADSDGRRAEG